MANSELSKLKILFIYDYFKNQVSAEGGKEAVSVSELISYLEEVTGTTFERKSIYADISKINEYVQKSGQTKDSEWIFSEGKKYKRNELRDEILIDEARLIVDAISTTTFVDSDLCEKIIKMFPTYFPEGYQNRALYPHYEKMDRKSILLLNNIRSGIETKSALKISYGYMLGKSLTEKTDKVVSPMALDWENNCYYLIAIDNEEAKDLENDHSLSKALRRYRVDRIASISVLEGKRRESGALAEGLLDGEGADVCFPADAAALARLREKGAVDVALVKNVVVMEREGEDPAYLPAVVLAASPNRLQAMAFLDFLTSETARGVLAGHGFSLP